MRGGREAIEMEREPFLGPVTGREVGQAGHSLPGHTRWCVHCRMVLPKASSSLSTPNTARELHCSKHINCTNRTKTQSAINAGKGSLLHDTESGQLLFDRVRHADVLHYLWWIGTFAPAVSACHGEEGWEGVRDRAALKQGQSRSTSAPSCVLFVL